MCDCEDSSDFSDDQKRPSVTYFESKMKQLNFSNYECSGKKSLEDAIFLIDFDDKKLTVEKENDVTYNILYDGKPLRVATKVFSLLIKKSKEFPKEKRIKVKDPMVSHQLWHVFWAIETAVRVAELENKNYLYYVKPYSVYFDPDERCFLNHIYYCEDCVIAFDQAIILAERAKSKNVRVVSQVIDCKVAVPS